MNIKAFKSMVWKAWEQNSYDIKSLSVVLLNSITFFSFSEHFKEM